MKYVSFDRWPNVLFLFFIFSLTFFSAAGGAEPQPGNTAIAVQLETSMGVIGLELNPQAAPKSVENFLSYVDSGFYTNTIFHRVIKNFMIQGGGFTADMENKKTSSPIANEADNGLKNSRGTIAMARTSAPHSASSQFFINTVDNLALDHKNKSQQGWGYCVFGKVISGMEVVDAIAAQSTTKKGMFSDVPTKPITILKASRIETKMPEKASE